MIIPNEGKAFNIVTSRTKEESKTDSILPGWPDVIACKTTDGVVTLFYAYVLTKKQTI